MTIFPEHNGVNPVVAEVVRSGLVESRHRGAVAGLAADGTQVVSAGDTVVPFFPRSANKPLQATAMLRAGAELDGELLALAAASHSGEDYHVDGVRKILSGAGLTESDLGCPPSWPLDLQTARRLIARGEGMSRIRMNCSGKHAAMLATCAVMGWPLDGYMELGHPCQQAVSRALQEMLGIDLDTAHRGIDGCGLTTYGIPLMAIARGFAVASADAAFRRAQEAMAAHPFLVAGTGRFDTALLEVAGADLTAKIGGAAVWAAVVRTGGPGIAIKLESGSGEAIPVVAIALLQQLGVLSFDLPERLRPFATLTMRNWAGRDVGEIRADPRASATSF